MKTTKYYCDKCDKEMALNDLFFIEISANKYIFQNEFGSKCKHEIMFCEKCFKITNKDIVNFLNKFSHVEYR